MSRQPVFKKRSERQEYRNIRKKVVDTIELSVLEHPPSTSTSFSNSGCSDDREYAPRSLCSTLNSVGSIPNLDQQFEDESLTSDSIDSEIELGGEDGNVLVHESEIQPINSEFFLRNWSTKNNITHTALSELLTWFSTNPDISNLPRDARTLMGTPAKCCVKQMGDGQFYYFGLSTSIIKIFERYKDFEAVYLLDFNIDGLPIYKSTNSSFWPILGKIANHPTESPFPVAIYYGPSKPPLEDYLHEFVKDLEACINNGILYKDRILKIKVRYFCCDAPASAYIKNTKGHNAYFGCSKCCVRGQYMNRKMAYLEQNAELRTDESFDLKLCREYHKGDTPLSKLGIGLVSHFMIDYMHCVCLGVMRKLLFLLRDGGRLLLSKGNCRLLNERIHKLKSFWPIEFNRKPRSLEELERWKATELRQFLLYIGVLVLPGLVSPHIYSNFLLLKCGTTILLNGYLNRNYNQYANTLLRLFVKDAVNLYGKDFAVFNVHQLIHLADEAKHLSSLEDINCFAFENYLYTLKKQLRKTNAPLQQIVNRMMEKQKNDINSDDMPSENMVYLMGHGQTKFNEDTQESETIYTKLHLKRCIVTNTGTTPMSVIPETWLTPNKKNCYWPFYLRTDAAINKAIFNYAAPNVPQCAKCPIVVKYRTGYYQKAKDKMEVLENASSVSSDSDVSSRRTPKPNSQLDDYIQNFSDDDADGIPTVPPPNIVRIETHQTPRPLDHFEYVEQNTLRASPSVQSSYMHNSAVAPSMTINLEPSTSRTYGPTGIRRSPSIHTVSLNSSSVMDILQGILKTQEQMRKDIRHILHIQLQNNEGNHSNFISDEKWRTVSTIEELKELNKKLNSAENMTEAVN
ncbi:hypothetical protein PPYR_15099 [Photinus pyralis]|uniref:Transposase domain-containing protein n=1 Tax=Photinus pyralis TaxID=7054 RepID=A0A5N3ZZL5_PHOPY|nr:hypothetical protein PPYR_15099 [Photinus pyralis]